MKNKKPINVFERQGLKVANYGDSAEIVLHGNIIDDTDGEWLRLADDNAIGYCYPAKVKEALDGLKGVPVDVHIASDGGNVAAGVAIYNMLRQHDAAVNVYVDAWAASIASLIAMSGNKIYMPSNAFMMIHNPVGGALGDASYLRAVAEWLDKLQSMLAETYAKRSGVKSVEDFLALMNDETWLTANEAKDLWPDAVEILEDENAVEAVACFSSLKNAPKAVNAKAIEKAKAEAARLEDVFRNITEVIERSYKV